MERQENSLEFQKELWEYLSTGERIKQWRKEENLTIDEVSKLFNVSKTTWAEIERTETFISDKVKQEIMTLSSIDYPFSYKLLHEKKNINKSKKNKLFILNLFLKNNVRFSLSLDKITTLIHNQEIIYVQNPKNFSLKGQIKKILLSMAKQGILKKEFIKNGTNGGENIYSLPNENSGENMEIITEIMKHVNDKPFTLDEINKKVNFPKLKIFVRLEDLCKNGILQKKEEGENGEEKNLIYSKTDHYRQLQEVLKSSETIKQQAIPKVHNPLWETINNPLHEQTEVMSANPGQAMPAIYDPVNDPEGAKKADEFLKKEAEEENEKKKDFLQTEVLDNLKTTGDKIKMKLFKEPKATKGEYYKTIIMAYLKAHKGLKFSTRELAEILSKEHLLSPYPIIHNLIGPHLSALVKDKKISREDNILPIKGNIPVYFLQEGKQADTCSKGANGRILKRPDLNKKETEEKKSTERITNSNRRWSGYAGGQKQILVYLQQLPNQFFSITSISNRTRHHYGTTSTYLSSLVKEGKISRKTIDSKVTYGFNTKGDQFDDRSQNPMKKEEKEQMKKEEKKTSLKEVREQVILDFLKKSSDEKFTTSELAKEISLSKGTISSTLSSLCKQGKISRNDHYTFYKASNSWAKTPQVFFSSSGEQKDMKTEHFHPPQRKIITAPKKETEKKLCDVKEANKDDWKETIVPAKDFNLSHSQVNTSAPQTVAEQQKQQKEDPQKIKERIVALQKRIKEKEQAVKDKELKLKQEKEDLFKKEEDLQAQLNTLTLQEFNLDKELLALHNM